MKERLCRGVAGGSAALPLLPPPPPLPSRCPHASKAMLLKGHVCRTTQVSAA